MKANDTAFPAQHPNPEMNTSGLTVRDHIAIQAMTGLLAAVDGAHNEFTVSVTAAAAYKLADAMIEESER